MFKTAGLGEFIEKHRLLDDTLVAGRDGFISDWNGGHPFVDRFLGPKLSAAKIPRREFSRYHYIEDDPAVHRAIRRLHQTHEGLTVDRENIVAGPGSSSLLAAFSVWLLQHRFEEVCYVPPLYYTFHFLLRTLGIRTRPVTGTQLFEPTSRLNLPRRKSVLLFCDPIWFAGRSVDEEHIDAIACWQRRTGSLVFVDGSFQFMQWDGSRKEHTSRLDPDLTFRLICPAKALAVPAFRFAYILHPRRFHREFLFTYESIVGALNVFDREFALRAVRQMTTSLGNRPLTAHLQSTYQQLVARQLISDVIPPNCGYFIFAVPQPALNRRVVMDQEYFELKGYPRHARINLLLAPRSALDRRKTSSRSATR